MVGLPSVESREMILRTLLSKEKVEDLDYKELAAITEGYSGSDLKVFEQLRLILCFLDKNHYDLVFFLKYEVEVYLLSFIFPLLSF